MKINYKIGICAECGKEKTIVQKSLKLCFFCNQVRLARKYAERRKIKVRQGEKADKGKLQQYYKKMWALLPHVCYESNVPLYNYHSWHVHHVLHKEDFPELAFNEDVSVLLSLEVHANWHATAPSDRSRKFPNTYKKYVELCHKYHITPEF